MNSLFKPNILTGYINCSVGRIKQRQFLCIENAFRYNSCINTDVSSNERFRTARNSRPKQVRKSWFYQFGSNRNFCTSTLPKDANVFGDLSNEKYEVTEMDEAEREEEEATENDASVPRWKKLSPGQYANLIKSHMKQGNLDLALSVLDLVKQNRDKPTLYMYSLLIYGFAQQGHMEKCFKLYNQLKKRGMVPNQAIYNSLLNACAVSTNTDKALECLESLRESFSVKDIALNETHYITLIKAYSWHKQIETAFRIADEARDKNLVSANIYAVLFHAAISDKVNGLRYALILWHQMKRYKIRPTIIHYNLLLRAIRDTQFGKLNVNECLISDSPATQITLQDAGRPDLLDSPPVLSFSLIALTKDKSNNRESKSLVKMDSEAVLHNQSVTISNSLNKILRNNRLILFGGIEKILERMKNDNVIPDVRTITMLMELLPPSLEAENLFLKYVDKEKFTVDVSFFNMLIKRRNLRKQFTEAKSVLIEIQKHHLMPDVITFGVLALGCQKIAYGIELLEQMNNVGYASNHIIIGALIHNACYGRNFKYVEFLLNYMLDYNMKPNKYIRETLENFEKLILKDLKMENRYNRKEIKQLQREYNSYKIAYDDWFQKMQKNNIVQVSRK
ncbi:pentatricopeptide repeat-containing protein 1, mitochondrial [Lasioglossum baleicum]|uniref:pentatricopeptide repeat-containing protein 1, mitochondrial n=1 Tax=Lasioglossum baleicum TaxID=434251 RepID=UPI003FCDAEBC